MAVGEGWQLLKIRGIPLRIHPTWFVILLLATLAFEQHYRLVEQLTLASAPLWLLAFATAVLLFLSLLLHELGHSLVALTQGVQVRSITLFLFGGVAALERECSTPISALLVAAAGPAVSLVLALLLLGLQHSVAHLSPVFGAMVEVLGELNLVLLLYNLLPGLPLDGGLILKALVWQITGSQRRGVVVANNCGRFLSYLAVGLGAVLLLRGGGVAGAWLMMIGWFGLGAARTQSQMLQIQQALRDLRVRDGARRRFRVLEGSTSLRRFSQLRLAAAPADGLGDWWLVCEGGRWQGVIDDQPLQQLPVQCWDRERVADHLLPLSSLPQIRDSDPLWRAALGLETALPARLLVLSSAGLPSGTIERAELGEAVLQRLGLRLPAALVAQARRQNAYPLGLDLGQVARGMLSVGEVADAGAAAAR